MFNITKILRCYCNDDIQCDHKDYCDTHTVCITKRVIVDTKKNSTKLKYYCGEQPGNSLRTEILQFRDCLVTTTNKDDYDSVMKNYVEQCCDTGDYCNKNLNPIRAYNDWADLTRSTQYLKTQNHHSNSKHNDSNIVTLTPLQVSLIACSFLILLFIALLVVGIIYLHKRKNLTFKNSKTEKSTLNYDTSGVGGGGIGTDVSKLNSKSEIYPFLASNFQAKDDSINNNNNQNKKQKQQFCFPIKKKFSFMRKLHRVPVTEKVMAEIIKENDIDRPYIIGYGITNYVNSSLNSASTSTDGRTTTTNLSSDIQSSLLNTTSQGTDDNMLMSQNDYMGTICYTGSGSGSGNPICVQRTVARDIKLIECIGKGRYGEVWKGKWFGEETVAVKTFNSAEEKSWENEVNIYLTQCLRDENILGFIAADNIDRGLYTELWLITDYHEKGSLFDYLTTKIITPKQAFFMCFSIVKGLVHLHRAINGCKGKLALAHCDLKSKNILVKRNLTCCISDLGLALCGDSEGNVQQCTEIRTGTKRYMAPEILNKTIDYRKIDAYQKADMYALALVFWEMLRRCELTDSGLNTNPSNTLDYQPPFYDTADLNPDENQMRRLVCEQKCRPEIPPQCRNTNSKFILELTRLIEELWADKAEARLNALRVRKTLEKYLDDFDTDNSNV